MDDLFETDFSFLVGLQVEEAKTDKPVVRRSGGKIREVAGLTYQVLPASAHCEKTRAKISASLKGRRPKMAGIARLGTGKPIQTPFGAFKSVNELTEKTGKTKNWFWYMQKNYPDQYYYITKDAK